DPRIERDAPEGGARERPRRTPDVVNAIASDIEGSEAKGPHGRVAAGARASGQERRQAPAGVGAVGVSEEGRADAAEEFVSGQVEPRAFGAGAPNSVRTEFAWHNCCARGQAAGSRACACRATD